MPEVKIISEIGLGRGKKLNTALPNTAFESSWAKSSIFELEKINNNFENNKIIPVENIKFSEAVDRDNRNCLDQPLWKTLLSLHY